jgi:hypothetical protein
MKTNLESILSSLQDELHVLIFIAKSDNRMVAAEREIIVRYAEERAKDKRIYFDAEVGNHIMDWVRTQKPKPEQLPSMLARVAQSGKDGIQALMEVTSIVAEMDDKMKPGELRELAQIQTLIKAHL